MNSYILYSYVLKFTWIHVTFILIFWNVENLNLSEPEKILFGYFFSMYFPCILIKIFYTICRRSLHSRTVFKNLKNQSQCFMTIFRNLKNQSTFYNHHASRISIKQFKIFFKDIVHYLLKSKNTRVLLKWTEND